LTTRGPSLTTQILVGLAAGVAAGVALGKDASPLGEVGKLVIQAIKVAATPLLLLAIVNAVLSAEVKAKSGLRMIVLASINAVIALAFGLAVSNVLRPGRHLETITATTKTAFAAQPLDPLKVLTGFVPTSLVQPFAENNLLPLVGMALLLALALRRLKDAEAPVQGLEQGVQVLQRACEIVLGWIILTIPLAVFGVVAKAVGEHGVAPLRGLAWYLAAGLIGLALHPLVTYQLWLAFFARLSLVRFWGEAKAPLVYAVGANSSLATLPLTLKALDRLGVSKASSALGACVGTNLNNDGIILYEGMAVLFVAQAYGIELSLTQQIIAAVCCMVAAMGIAGVPEAGFVSLSLVLATVGLPLEILGLLLTVDWVLGRARSVVNVLSDMMVSILLDRWDGRRFDDPPETAGALAQA
jgi:DAACS family dicarboxylate/amino acid:cation (Na+ or H+) symporter